MARNQVIRQLIRQFNGEPVHRQGVITDNGNEIVDVHGLYLHEPERVEQAINQLPGVVTNGIFALRKADIVLLAKASGVEKHVA